MPKNNESPLKIVQVMLSSQNGGAETFFDKLTLALADAGVRQCAVIEPNRQREALLGAHPNITIRTIRFRGIHEVFGQIRIRWLMRQWQPDLAMAWMGRAIKRCPKGTAPIISRLGGYYAVDRFRKADHLIGNTPDIVRYLIEEGIPAKKTQCIPNFGEVRGFDGNSADAKAALRAEHNIPDDHTLLLALGRLHRAKAHDVLLQAMTKTPRANVLLAGDGPERDALHAQAQALGLVDRVHFLGWRRDIAKLFAGADMCVFPSRHEPFGNVVVESWAQRTPLVAAASKGPAWLIEPDENALLVPVDDPDALAASIIRLRDDEALASRLVENGYRTFEKHYSQDAIVSQYLDMFRDVLARR